jgi:hypothetical protein
VVWLNAALAKAGMRERAPVGKVVGLYACAASHLKDGCWKLVPPKSGRSNPMSEQNKTKTPRQHWRSGGSKKQISSERNVASGDGSSSSARGSKREGPQPPATPTPSDEPRPRHKRVARSHEALEGKRLAEADLLVTRVTRCDPGQPSMALSSQNSAMFNSLAF